MANMSIFCGNFFNWLEIEKYAFSFDIYFSISNQFKKLPQKNWHIGHCVNFWPEFLYLYYLKTNS